MICHSPIRTYQSYQSGPPHTKKCPFGTFQKVKNNFPDFCSQNWGIKVGKESLFYFIYPVDMLDGWSKTPCVIIIIYNILNVIGSHQVQKNINPYAYWTK